MKGLVKRFMLGGCLALFLILTLIQGQAWYRVSQDKAYVDKALEDGYVTDEKGWNERYRRLSATEHLAKVDADIFWTLGEMHQLRATELRLWPARQREEWETAKRYYFSALMDSPGDAVLLAQVSARLALARDPQALELMQWAFESAPYEPAAHYSLAEAGMLLWTQLDPVTRKSFEVMIERARKEPKAWVAIKKLADRNGWSSVLATL